MTSETINSLPSVVNGRRRPAVQVKLQRINCNSARSYPPDGEGRVWWGRLKRALGTTSSDFVSASLIQLQSAARLPLSGISEIAVNAALAMIEAAAPRDEIEGALAVQMACTHTAAMAVLAALGGAHGTDRRVAALAAAAARLMRTYAIQVEVQRRLRHGGEQYVRVEQVHINDGGQALIGNVKKPDGRAENQPHEPESLKTRLRNLQRARRATGPAFAADLVRSGVSVIVASTSPAVPVAKAASSTIPIVFSMGGDPVRDSLVASLSRPGGNLTGVTTLNVELGPKRLELMHELVPTTTVLGLLINPTNFAQSEILSRDVRAAARSVGLEIHVLPASTEGDLDAVFESLSQLRVGALVIGADPFFNSRSERLAALALRYAVPAIYQYRPFAAAGGLMSYGGNIAESYRQVGVYVGRILKGESPADLPVQQFTKIELIINLKTAKALGLTVPVTLLGRADEVIE
jgi:putative tryptophan/tyrosine transport system substrate-binding protein